MLYDCADYACLIVVVCEDIMGCNRRRQCSQQLRKGGQAKDMISGWLNSYKDKIKAHRNVENGCPKLSVQALQKRPPQAAQLIRFSKTPNFFSHCMQVLEMLWGRSIPFPGKAQTNRRPISSPVIIMFCFDLIAVMSGVVVVVVVAAIRS